MSPSERGNRVPCQAAGGGISPSSVWSETFCLAEARSTAAETRISEDEQGTSGVKRVQSLPTSGRIAGKTARSRTVGSQVGPSGGPKSAQVFSSLASAEVVNLASQEWEAASGGVVNASKPKAAVMCPLCVS